MGAIKFTSITFSSIKQEIERFLQGEYNKAGILFSPASPYGQILSVIENLHQLSILYLKNAINQFDLSSPNSVNPRVIRNYAILAGHEPSRSVSATGTLKLTLKTDSNESDIPGGRITLFNRTSIRNNTNSLDYSLDLGKEKITHRINNRYTFFVPIIQGKWETETFTGDGSELQSFSIDDEGIGNIENFNFEVIVNGETWSTKKHIWELLPDEKACIVRTGFNNGIDIVFGNSGFGSIPEIGSIIEVNYLISEGSRGNIFRRTRNDWKFVGDVIDGNGQTIDVSELFDIDIYTDINFGADEESLLFTKNILPVSSNNYILATPQQYAYYIKRLGVFSHVNAYEESGSIFIVATPNVRLFKNQNSDYFTVDIRAFELDRYEKSKIDRYLKSSGTIQLTKKWRIDSPKISYYVMTVYVISYSDATDESVEAQILDKISEYFLDLKRVDRIPKLDIIKVLSEINDIHSVDVKFTSKKNEDYHRENIKNIENKIINYDTSFNSDISIKKPNDYDKNLVLGLDPVMGDILFEPDELPMIRGGWQDRNGVFYSNDITGSQLKSVNIIRKGKIDSRNRI